ncbi:ABC transporter permease [Labilibaculum sp. K2S]|uniref:ABC transporter permease n=1 Tax=Labilibaculum sp. K2S TaxID=3056386 RepID=UPI0025A32C25|nr:ABC transporter permease [Labilibaculum sp. K2S]MDM8161748.1 ABC transporter permease [Labilibaculum sp. K2S]
MILNFFKVAFRNMRKYKGYTFINIVGLAVGLACVFLIYLFVQDELSYDKFYPKYKDIYRVATKVKMGERKMDGNTICAPFSPNAVADFPEVKYAVRINFWNNVLFKYEDKQFVEDKFLRTDSTFFEVFSRPFVFGDSRTALKEKNNIVLTQSTSQKYFGDANPVGKILKMTEDKLFTVSGVVEDVPENSHFHYDLVGLLNLSAEDEDAWFSDYMQAYFLLEPGTNYKDLEAKFSDFTIRHMGPKLIEVLGIDIVAWEKNGNEFKYYLEPLESIYLKTTTEGQIEPVSDIKYIYIFSVIAFFILLLACVNFLNLTTARSYTRAREVGVRKVFGSNRNMLMIQFYAETFLMALLAAVISFFLVELTLPYFNEITRKNLMSPLLWRGEYFLFVGSVIAFVVLFAGSYTAISLSGFKVMRVLKGEVQKGRLGKRIRAGLVIFQFTVAIGILISAFIVKEQVNFMQEKKLGFDKERVLVVDRAYALEDEQRISIKEKLKEYSGIEDVSFSGMVPGRGTNGWSMYREGASNEDMINFRLMHVDENFIDLLGLKIIDGRKFDKNRLSDSSVFIANEAAIAALGYTDNPVGRNIYKPNFNQNGREAIEIIGVIEDFHFESMRDKILPMLLVSDPKLFKCYMLVKLQPDNVMDGVKLVKKYWSKMTAGEPFEYFFLDSDFNNLFKGEERVANILSSFTILAFFIALLGLLGLVSFEMQQRVKEIGIRKVLGSSEFGLMMILSRSLCLNVVIANIIAWPLTYFVMQHWLSNFVYRINFPWYYFPFALLMSIILTLVTVSGHSLKVARANPIESLKYE